MILTDLIYYDLKVAALIAVFYLFYMLLLARETTHTLNRAVLLAAIGLSVVLPLCIITIHEKPHPQPLPLWGGEYIDLLTDVPQTLSAEEVNTSLSLGEGWGVRLVGVLFLVGFLIRLWYIARGYWKLHRMIANGERHTLLSGTQVCVVNAPVAPFSWMRTIVLSRSDYLLSLSKGSGEALILAHEEAHVRHRHSYDVVVVEVLTALQWFNPVVWFLRQELRTLHEYEADASVLSRGFDESQYIHLLMQKATGIQACALANGITTHRTKKRIFMMLKPKSNRSAWLKALYIVPVVLVSLAMTAKTVVNYESATAEEPQMPMLRVFNDNAKGECYQVRHTPGVKFFLNGKEEEIPDNRPIALEASKTTLQSNGVEVSHLPLSRIPVGMLREIHIDEVSPGHFVANFVTEEKGKTIYIVNGVQVSQDTVNVQSDDPVFDICEQMPSFPGGDAKLMEFIARNIKYPEVATKNGVQGRVLVKFIVEKDGSLSNAKVLDSPKTAGTTMVVVTAYMPDKEREEAEEHNAGVQALRDEAIRVINAMPKWTPGRQNGNVVRCNFVIPVTYRLQ